MKTKTGDGGSPSKKRRGGSGSFKKPTKPVTRDQDKRDIPRYSDTGRPVPWQKSKRPKGYKGRVPKRPDSPARAKK